MKRLVPLTLCLALCSVVLGAQTPTQPASEATLRKYFEACHFATSNRIAIDKQLAVQQKTLPPWFPPSIWNETVQAIEEIDAVALAIPVYQRYFSEETAINATRLFLTPSGQAMVNKVYEATIAHEVEGDSSDVARRKAVESIRAQEDAEVRTMLKQMTPAQQRQTQAFVQSSEWKRVNDAAPQRNREFADIYMAKQKEISTAVFEKHRDEGQKAYRDYVAAHPEAASSK